MGDQPERPGYWAVLPAMIRYDEKLPPNAKLLYAEISSLTDMRGYCYATNAYFEKLYNLSERTISRLLGALEKAGYVCIEDSAGGRDQRKLYVGINPLSAPPDKKVSTPRQNCLYPLTEMSIPPDKNVGGNKNKKDNKKDTIPPKAPHGGRRAKSVPEWEPQMFERFWKAYPKEGRTDRVAAVREWDRLKPDMPLMHRMSRALDLYKASDLWKRGISIPYACRWLSHRRWEDPPDPAPSCAIQQAGCVQSPEVETW